MIEQTITESQRLRIIDYHCRISLGQRFGRELVHESSRVNYIPLPACVGKNYFADYDRESSLWILTDSSSNRLGKFPTKSSMTRWVRKRIA